MLAPRDPRVTLAAACGSTALVMALTTAVLMSIPVMGRELSASQSELQWVGDSYPLLLAALLLPAGALLDRHGRRRGMLIGLTIVLGSLLLGAVAHTIELVLVARVLSGVGSALLFPGTLATIAATLGEDRRQRGAMYWAASALAGGFIGLLTAAVVVDLVNWQAPFFVFAVIAGLLLVATVIAVPETYDSEHAHLDPAGAMLGLVSMGGLVLCMTEGPVKGWSDPLVLVSGVIGTLALAWFVVWERRCSAPLLDVCLFADRRFSAAAITVFLLFFVDYAVFFLANQYLNYVLGWGPAHAGLALVPPVIGTVVAIPFVPALMRRCGGGFTMSLALSVCAVGTAVLVAMSGRAGYMAIAPGLFIFWIGLGLGMAPPTAAILDAIPDVKHGVASAVNDLSRELGAALGIALAGAAFNAGYRADVTAAIGTRHDVVARTIIDSPAAGLRSIAGRTDPHGDRLRAVVAHGVLDGWRIAFVLFTGCLLIGAALVALRHPRPAEESAAALGGPGTRPAPALGESA